MFGSKGLFCTAALLVASVVMADDRAATVEALLKELRELKQVQRSEARQAADEFRQAKRLLALRAKNAETAAQTIRTLEKAVAEREAALATATREIVRLELRIRALDTAVTTSANTLSDRAKTNDFLLSATAIKRLQTVLAASSTKLPTRCAGLLSVMLDSATDMVRPRLVNQTITVDGKERHVEAIHFGALFALWRTMDGNHCGHGVSDGTKTTYGELPRTDQASIDKACRILRNEEPASVLQLPIPKAGSQP